MAAAQAGASRPRDRTLTVYWKGEEVPGALVYGLRHPDDPQALEVTFPWREADSGPPWLLHGEGWAVDLWTVRLTQMPTGPAWTLALRQTLERLAQAGYVVSWFAPEGDFVDPPELFDPDVVGHGVYAAYSDVTGFLCRDDGTGRLSTLSRDDVARVRLVAEKVWRPVDEERPQLNDGGSPPS